MNRFLTILVISVAMILAGCADNEHGDARPAPGPSDAGRSTATVDAGPAAGDIRSRTEIRGTRGNDRLVGTSLSDVIDGGRGSDTILGRGGDDELMDYTGVGTGRRLDTTIDVFRGGAGADHITSSTHDRVWGGSGNDTIEVTYLASGDMIDCGPGRDVVVMNDDYPDVALHGCETIRVRPAG